MWELFLKAETFGKLPSQCLRVPPLRNDLAAYQFDNAILFAGLVIKNASQEREWYGPENARESRPKYTLTQLLDPDFRLPSGDASSNSAQGGGIKAIVAANPGIVGRWREARPGELAQ
jgi:hypothetical protein